MSVFRTCNTAKTRFIGLKLKKDWIIREQDDKFDKGDLVLVKRYSCYDLSNPLEYKDSEFGDIAPTSEVIEELLNKDNVYLGIVISKEVISWEPDAEMWMTMTMDKPYKLVQFRVHCFDVKGTIKTKLIDATAMKLVSKGEIGRGIEESINNLTNNNKQQERQ